MPGINEKLLNSIEIPVPSADKQAKLVHAAEEMNRAEDALLEGIAADANLILSLANCMTSQTLEKP
jgi:restriction endonuclease S subunit